MKLMHTSHRLFPGISSGCSFGSEVLRRLLYAVLLIPTIIAVSYAAPQYVYITGKTLDAAAGTPLKDTAVCTIPESQVVLSNSAGVYRIKVIKGYTYRIYYLKSGYNPATRETGIVPNAGRTIDCALYAINNQYSVYPPPPAYPLRTRLVDPPVHVVLPGKAEIAGIIRVSTLGYKRNPSPGAWEWDLHYSGAVSECEASYALSGVKVSTVPATSVSYSDNFGIYRLQGIIPGVKYRIRAEKSGYSLKTVCDREYTFPQARYYINELMMDTVSSNPRIRFFYGTAATGKKASGYYNNYAVISFPPPVEFGEVFYTINDERPIYSGNSYKYYARYYSNPLFIDTTSVIRMVSWNWGSVRTPTIAKTIKIARGKAVGTPCFIVLCAEIEEFGENSSSAFKWINNELPCANPYNAPDTRISISVMNTSGSKTTWSRPLYTKIQMNTCNPYWDHRTSYSAKEGFRFKVTCEDIDKYGNPQRTDIQNLGVADYRITASDIAKGYISLSFGAVKRLIILLNDTGVK